MASKPDHKPRDPGARSDTVDALISREIVKIYTDFYGRGPTKAKTRRRADIVICILEDVFTKAERVLLAAGSFEQVRLNRGAIRTAIEPRIGAVVAAATARPVEACMGQVTAEGRACEICLLGPEPADAP